MAAVRRAVALGLIVAAWGSAARGLPILSGIAGEFNSSEQCGACHRDIHAAWKQSIHARSLEDPIFLDSLRQLSAEGGDVRLCLDCHAPLVRSSRDFTLEKKLSWEGVTCDYCHSIAEIAPGTIPKPKLQVGATKFGPIPDVASSAHETAYRQLFKESELCAGCHEYVAPSGVPILSTYSEWKASPQASEGKTCQTCHMSEVKANVVDPRVKRTAGATVNLHGMPGGHSIEQLNRALSVRARPTRTGDKIELRVEINNRGAGHTVPTGSAARQITLEVRVDTNQGKEEHQSRVYQLVLTDAEGKPLLRDRDLFARAARLQSDTRLKPREIREERFVFDVGSQALANIKLRLVYRHTAQPEPDEPPAAQVFFSQSWTLPPG